MAKKPMTAEEKAKKKAEEKAKKEALLAARRAFPAKMLAERQAERADRYANTMRDLAILAERARRGDAAAKALLERRSREIAAEQREEAVRASPIGRKLKEIEARSLFETTEPRFTAEQIFAPEEARRSSVEVQRTGRMARSASFPMREESGRLKEAVRFLKKTEFKDDEEAQSMSTEEFAEAYPVEVEMQLQRGDKPSAKAELRPRPFFRDSMIKRERAEVVSREPLKNYECECGKMLDRDQTPLCLCKVRAGSIFEKGVKTRKKQRRSKDRAAATEVKVRAHNATEAALKAKLAVAQPDVRGRGGREALLTPGREMSRVSPQAIDATIRARFEQTAQRADMLERKLRDAEEGRLSLNSGQRDALRRDIAKLRKKANELRDIADSQRRYGSESQAFKLGGLEDNMGWIAVGLIGLGAFAIYRSFQRPPTA